VPVIGDTAVAFVRVDPRLLAPGERPSATFSPSSAAAT
jgi:hypothetical protein